MQHGILPIFLIKSVHKRLFPPIAANAFSVCGTALKVSIVNNNFFRGSLCKEDIGLNMILV